MVSNVNRPYWTKTLVVVFLPRDESLCSFRASLRDELAGIDIYAISLISSLSNLLYTIIKHRLVNADFFEDYMMDEVAIRLHVEPLDEGGFLATSPDVPGLIAEGRSIVEAVEISRFNEEDSWNLISSMATHYRLPCLSLPQKHPWIS